MLSGTGAQRFGTKKCVNLSRPYWCSFAIQVIMSIFCLIMLFSNISGYASREADCGSSKLACLSLLSPRVVVFATLWSLYVCAGFTLSSFYVVVRLIKLIDYKKVGYIDRTHALDLCVPPTVYCIGLFLITYCLKSKLT